jgi:hypothetical protein
MTHALEERKTMNILPRGTENIGGVKAELRHLNQNWEQRVGKYRALKRSNSNWFNEAELTLQNDIPVPIVPLINVGQTAPFQMKILDDNLAAFFGLGRYSGNVLEFTSAPQGTELANFVGVEMQMVPQ